MLFVVEPFTFSAMSHSSSSVLDSLAPVTPLSNTGSMPPNPLDGLESSLDFYQATGRYDSTSRMWEMFEYLCSGFDQKEIYTLPHGLFCGINWEFSATTLDGLKIAWNLLSDGQVHCWVNIPGGCFHMVSLRDALRTIGGATHQFLLKCTRIDFKLRDYDRVKLPHELFAEFEYGNVRGVRSRQFITSGERGSLDDTIYFGSRESEKRLRVYDANHNHGVNAVDWELQIRKNSAVAAVAMLTEAFYSDCEDSLGLCQTLIGAGVAGFVRFIKDGDKKEHVDTDRCELQDWYEGFRIRAGGALRIPSPRPSTSVTQKMVWLFKQVSCTLSCFEEGLGKNNFRNWLEELISQGRERMTKSHEALVAQLRRERSRFLTS